MELGLETPFLPRCAFLSSSRLDATASILSLSSRGSLHDLPSAPRLSLPSCKQANRGTGGSHSGFARTPAGAHVRMARRRRLRELLLLVMACLVVSGAPADVQESETCAGEAMGSVDVMQVLNEEDLHYILKTEPSWRLKNLGKVSDSADNLERTFLSPAWRRAATMVRAWLEDAGMRTWMDGIGNIHGRIEGEDPDAPAIVLGSHLDTVLDAGMYDGALGVVLPISAVKALQLATEYTGKKLKKSVEIIGFSDEEGVRFQSTFLGSRAVAGHFPPELLHAVDNNQVTLAEALNDAGLLGKWEAIQSIAMDPDKVAAYVEVHMEQGPQLERLNTPVGIVNAIAGQNRIQVRMHGEQGHAGTVPMPGRRDTVAAAGEAINEIEKRCGGGNRDDATSTIQDLEDQLVCTVGEVLVWPGASNVISGNTNFSIDIRARRDETRLKAVEDIVDAINRLCERRKMDCEVVRKHEAAAVACQDRISSLLAAASKDMIASYPGKGWSIPPTLTSGAGHDALAMSELTDIAMLFVRCRGGVSHSPLEHVSEEDIEAATRTLLIFLQQELT